MSAIILANMYWVCTGDQPLHHIQHHHIYSGADVHVCAEHGAMLRGYLGTACRRHVRAVDWELLGRCGCWYVLFFICFVVEVACFEAACGT